MFKIDRVSNSHPHANTYPFYIYGDLGYLHRDGIVRPDTVPYHTGYYPTREEANIVLTKYLKGEKVFNAMIVCPTIEICRVYQKYLHSIGYTSGPNELRDGYFIIIQRDTLYVYENKPPVSTQIMNITEIPSLNIMIYDKVVEFTSEGIKVGCRTVSKDTVEKIYRKLFNV